MPLLSHHMDFPVTALWIDVVVEPDEYVEITDEQASRCPRTGVWFLTDTDEYDAAVLTPEPAPVVQSHAAPAAVTVSKPSTPYQPEGKSVSQPLAVFTDPTNPHDPERVRFAVA